VRRRDRAVHRGRRRPGPLHEHPAAENLLFAAALYGPAASAAWPSPGGGRPRPGVAGPVVVVDGVRALFVAFATLNLDTHTGMPANLRNPGSDCAGSPPDSARPPVPEARVGRRRACGGDCYDVTKVAPGGVVAQPVGRWAAHQARNLLMSLECPDRALILERRNESMCWAV